MVHGQELLCLPPSACPLLAVLSTSCSCCFSNILAANRKSLPTYVLIDDSFKAMINQSWNTVSPQLGAEWNNAFKGRQVLGSLFLSELVFRMSKNGVVKIWESQQSRYTPRWPK